MLMKTIVLDPGHYDKGNPYPAASGFYEGNQMFKLAYLIKPLLEASGIKVLITRAKVTDNPSLEARGRLAGTNKADLFISLHSDAVGSTATDSARGVTCFYSKFNATENKEIATKLTASISKYMGTRDRGAQIRLGNGNLDYYGVIRSAAASGCTRAFLLEHGFHSSPSDVKFLTSDTSLMKIAEIDAKILAEAVGCVYKGGSAKPATENATSSTSNSTSTISKVTFKTNDVVIFKANTTPVYGGSAAGKRVPISVINKINSDRTTKITKFTKCMVNGSEVNCGLLNTINSWVPLKYLEIISHTGSTNIKTSTTTTQSSKDNYSTQLIFGEIKGSMEKINTAIIAKNPKYDKSITTAFWTIAPIYGIRGDVALCQSILETGWFRYTGGTAVTPDQHNYCGLGVVKLGVKGNSFPTISAGVEAQIQHLYAYASDKPIPDGRKMYDPRFNYVARGSAKTWKQLEGKWCAANSDYAKKIFDIYNQIFG